MSGVLIAFFLGAGVAAWVYNYIYKHTGGNVTNSSIVAGVAGVFGFVITLIAWNVFGA